MSGNTLTWRVEGLRELEDNLRRLRSDVAAKWVNGGLRAGMRVIELAAEGNVPMRSGQLKGTIRVRRGRKVSDDNRREYFVAAGSRKAGGGGAFYAHFQELGTKPHAISARKGSALHFGGNYASNVNHPGNPATHFLEKAARNDGPAAIAAFGAYIRAKLARAGLLNPAQETE